jgi:hypothetical protein
MAAASGASPAAAAAAAAQSVSSSSCRALFGVGTWPKSRSCAAVLGVWSQERFGVRQQERGGPAHLAAEGPVPPLSSSRSPQQQLAPAWLLELRERHGPPLLLLWRRGRAWPGPAGQRPAPTHRRAGEIAYVAGPRKHGGRQCAGQAALMRRSAGFVLPHKPSFGAPQARCSPGQAARGWAEVAAWRRPGQLQAPPPWPTETC